MLNGKQGVSGEANTISERIAFDDDTQVMEVDFTNLSFDSSVEVDKIHDEITACIKRTKRQWYFVFNYLNCQVRPDARRSWEARGQRLNLGHSLGSVHFNAGDRMGIELARRSREEPFYSNVVGSRERALGLIAAMRAQTQARQASAERD